LDATDNKAAEDANGVELITTLEELALAVGVSLRALKFYLFVASDDLKYTQFAIPKKSGASREISSPAPGLKAIQQQIGSLLQRVYKAPAPAHGFVPARSTITNARWHLRQKFVLNVDLKDFFPSINFGRVRGLLIAKPYCLQPAIATFIAKICCHKNALPQGAPTSPIISNMICSRLDRQLLKLAKERRCIYTRYADDLTFSTSMPRFPAGLAKQDVSDQGMVTQVGPELAAIPGG
jgi:RNA-directed DNA polymerase